MQNLAQYTILTMMTVAGITITTLIFITALHPSSQVSLLEGMATESGLCTTPFAPTARQPRGLFVTSQNELLGIERGLKPAAIVWYVEEKPQNKSNGMMPSSSKSVILARQSGLTHGLAINDDFIYASSDTTVYRFPLRRDDNGTLIPSGYGDVVIRNMNADGNGGAPRGHWTRTLVFDGEGRLYVSVGSYSNVDGSEYRSRIRRFDISGYDPSYPIEFEQGEVFADGLRNEVGLAFDRYGVLWGVENGADNLRRGDLGGDIHAENPGEELNRFKEDDAGKHYGYPYCWSEFSLDLPERSDSFQGQRWAWPSFMTTCTSLCIDPPSHINNGNRIDDGWCRNNTMESELSMQSHSAPLGIDFYHYKDELPPECDGIVGGLSKEYHGDAFIGFHGSWNRPIPTGYKVVRVPMTTDGHVNKTYHKPIPVDVMWHGGVGAKWPSGLRPVDVKFDRCGRLFVSSDGTRGVGDGIVMITQCANTSQAPLAQKSSDCLIADDCDSQPIGDSTGSLNFQSVGDSSGNLFKTSLLVKLAMAVIGYFFVKI